MTFASLNNAENWYFLVKMFSRKVPTLKRLIMIFMLFIPDHMLSTFVQNWERKYIMTRMK